MKISFHQLEECQWMNDKSIVCSFETQRFGYMQVGFDEGGVWELKNEPSLHNFTPAQQEYIERTLAIVHRLVFEAPAHETFK